MRAFARGDLPDTASVLVFIRDTIKQMEEGKLKRARQVMDWCPMLLRGMCVLKQLLQKGKTIDSGAQTVDSGSQYGCFFA